MYSLQDHRFFIYVVPQFGNLRIEAYLQLPAAYRSLSRPSSAPDAKAFTLCSFSLELPLFSLSCLSSHIIYFTMKKHFHTFYFLGFAYLSICGQIVVFHDFRKDLDFFDLNFFLNPVKLSVRFSYLVFNEHSCFPFRFTKFARLCISAFPPRYFVSLLCSIVPSAFLSVFGLSLPTFVFAPDPFSAFPPFCFRFPSVLLMSVSSVFRSDLSLLLPFSFSSASFSGFLFDFRLRFFLLFSASVLRFVFALLPDFITVSYDLLLRFLSAFCLSYFPLFRFRLSSFPFLRVSTPLSLRFFRFCFRSFRCYGGDEGNRTLDPLLAGQVLSQLSYTPINLGHSP